MEGNIYGLGDVVVNLGRNVLVRLVTIGREMSAVVLCLVLFRGRGGIFQFKSAEKVVFEDSEELGKVEIMKNVGKDLDEFAKGDCSSMA